MSLTICRPRPSVPSVGGATLARVESPSRVDGVTIERAIERFMASLKTRYLSWETLRKYEALLMRRLLPWCTERHFHVLTELGVVRLDEFRETWHDGPLYAAKNLDRLRAFFQFCMERDWIARNPARVLKAPRIRPLPTLPYSVEEMERILAACDQYRGNKNRMKAFVAAMRYSGLRISDATALHPDQLAGDQLRLYTTKTGQPVYMPLPPFVVEALKKIERPGQRYFSTGSARPSTARANWSRYLASLFALAHIENGHSSRFRDTFSTSLLEQGVSVETVAVLLGNTPAMVVKHYAPWVRSRQLALEAAVRMTWPFAIAVTRVEALGPSAAVPECRNRVLESTANERREDSVRLPPTGLAPLEGANGRTSLQAWWKRLKRWREPRSNDSPLLAEAAKTEDSCPAGLATERHVPPWADRPRCGPHSLGRTGPGHP